MKSQGDSRELRKSPQPECYLCGARGRRLHENLEDRLFGVPGFWDLKKCPDPGCGLVWLDPMPVEEDIGKAYESYYTHHGKPVPPDTWLRRIYPHLKNAYLARRYGYGDGKNLRARLSGLLLYLHPGRRADVDFSVMYLPARPGGRLLEVGCGSGQMLRLMKDFGWEVEGVDFDPAAVDNARGKGLSVRLGTLEDQVYPDDHFDAVTMSHLVEHVPEPLQLFQESYRILKPGGRLVVVTPNNESLGHRMFGRDWRGLEPPRHLHVFNLASLRKLTNRAGFDRYRASSTIRDANGMLIASRYLKRTDAYRMGSRKPLSVHAWARSLQFLEWALLKARPGVGEEISLIAEK